MADEEKDMEDAAEEQPAKKKSPIILVIILVIVGLVLAGGISFFVTTRMVANSANSDGGNRHHDPGVFVKLGDAKEGILVNVGGQNPGKEANVKDGKLQPEAETKILDTTMQYLRSVKLEQFDASKQDELKKQLKDELNDKLGQGSVYDVYITSFLLQ